MILPGDLGLRAAGLTLALGLAGCAEIGANLPDFTNSPETATPPAPAAELVAAESSLAPDTFEATGTTIWDGGSTLQGVWFAHPLAQRAQRVRVRNDETGRDVEGALFRRDPALAGPSIIVSSDAARALGLTPGSPTELTIVALRAGPAPAPVNRSTTTPSTPAAVESAPLAPPAAQAMAAPPPVEAPPVKASAAPEAGDAPAIAAPQAPPPPVARPERQAQAAQPAPAAVAPPADPGAALPSGRYLQVGSFGSEANAAALTERLRGQAQPARYVLRQINGREYAVLMIGPLTGDAAIADARAAAEAEGVKDSIEVSL